MGLKEKDQRENNEEVEDPEGDRISRKEKHPDEFTACTKTPRRELTSSPLCLWIPGQVETDLVVMRFSRPQKT